MFLTSSAPWERIHLDPDLGGEPGGQTSSETPASPLASPASTGSPVAPASAAAPSPSASHSANPPAGLAAAMTARLNGQASPAIPGAAGSPSGSTPTAPSPLSPETPSQESGQAGQMRAIRDYLASRGLDVSGYTSDTDWVERAIQAQQILAQHQDDIRFAQQMRPHASAYQQWYQQQVEAQRRQQQEAAAQGPKLWHTGFKPDPAFQYIERGDDGQLRVKPGAYVPPGVLEKYQEYEAGRAEWARAIIDNPAEALRPFEDQIIEKAIERMQTTVLRQRDEQSIAGQIVQQNAPWLWARDAQGNPVDQFGQPVNGMDGRKPALSQAGQRYHQIINDFERQFGVTDPQVLHPYAVKMLQGELAMAQYQQAMAQQQGSANGQQPAIPQNPQLALPGPGPGEGAGQTVDQVNQQQKKNFLNQALKQSAAAGAVAGNGAMASREHEGLNLRDRMRRNFVNAGGKLE